MVDRLVSEIHIYNARAIYRRKDSMNAVVYLTSKDVPTYKMWLRLTDKEEVPAV